jgi:hypothetical protein
MAGGAQRPFFNVNKLNKTGARSAWARRRGKNPLVTDSFRKSHNTAEKHPVY